MTHSEFQLFLSIGVGLCAFMMAVTLLRTRSRGLSAYFLAGGFLFMGLVLVALHEAWPQPIIIGFGVLVAAGLIGDFLLRAANGPQSR